MNIPACPHCGSPSAVRKWGHNRAGTQRDRCLVCQRTFTPAPKAQGHGVAIQEQAVRLYREGMSLRAIGRLLGVVHQSVANWVAAAVRQLPQRVSDPTPAKTIAVDELSTFVEEKRGSLCRDRGRAYESLAGRGVGHTSLRYRRDATNGGRITGGGTVVYRWIDGLPRDYLARGGMAYCLDRERGDRRD